MMRLSRTGVALALVSAVLLMTARTVVGFEGGPGESRAGFLPTCANGKKDGLETGVDCGGLNCPKCGPGKSCKASKDCQSNQCQANVCTFGATCNNGIKDASETDVDCGGIDNGCLRCCWNKLCKLNSDCQSSACEDGRCGEAQYCASRFFYDQLGTDIQLRTFNGDKAPLGQHQQSIKCGQCVCKDCPIYTTYFGFTLAGLCSSTANQATIAQLRADLIAQAQATDVKIYCVDTSDHEILPYGTSITGRRLSATTQAVYTASVCSPEKNLPLPLGQKTGEVVDGCVPVAEQTCIDYGGTCTSGGPVTQCCGWNDPAYPPGCLVGSDGVSRCSDQFVSSDRQVTLFWESTDDLDLWVFDNARGDNVSFDSPGPSASGGILDQDSTPGCSNTTSTPSPAEATPLPVENIYWPYGSALPGTYMIKVNLYGRCNGSTYPAPTAIPFTVRVLWNGVITEYPGTVATENPDDDLDLMVLVTKTYS